MLVRDATNVKERGASTAPGTQDTPFTTQEVLSILLEYLIMLELRAVIAVSASFRQTSRHNNSEQ